MAFFLSFLAFLLFLGISPLCLSPCGFFNVWNSDQFSFESAKWAPTFHTLRIPTWRRIPRDISNVFLKYRADRWELSGSSFWALIVDADGPFVGLISFPISGRVKCDKRRHYASYLRCDCSVVYCLVPTYMVSVCDVLSLLVLRCRVLSVFVASWVV